MNIKEQVKNKSIGWYLLAGASFISFVTMIVYIAFGASAHTFHGGVFVCLLFTVIIGVASFFYEGFFADFFGVATVALLMAAFGMLIGDSICDFADFITKIALYGNMNNAAPRLTILIFIIVSVVVAIAGCFFKRVKER